MPLRRRGRQQREQPARRAALAPARGTRGLTAFELLVEQALDGLAPGARRLLEDVAIVIEDEPTAEQLRHGGLAPDETLYGLYEGTPGTLYGSDAVPLPNKITLFRVPLEEDFPHPAELEDEVRRTVLHELAHHAGIDEDRLEVLGLH